MAAPWSPGSGRQRQAEGIWQSAILGLVRRADRACGFFSIWHLIPQFHFHFCGTRGTSSNRRHGGTRQTHDNPRQDSSLQTLTDGSCTLHEPPVHHGHHHHHSSWLDSNLLGPGTIRARIKPGCKARKTSHNNELGHATSMLRVTKFRQIDIMKLSQFAVLVRSQVAGFASPNLLTLRPTRSPSPTGEGVPPLTSSRSLVKLSC